MRACFLISAAVACLGACAPVAAPDSGDLTAQTEEFLGFVAGQEPLFEAGTAWAYSDTGYILLGLVTEEVMGRPHDDVVRRAFLNPLELTQTFPPDRRDLSRLAVGYTMPDNPFGLTVRMADAAGRLIWDPGVEWTSGALADLAIAAAR